MIPSLFVVFVLLGSCSPYLSDMCVKEAENVYFAIYKYDIDITVYHCSNGKNVCGEIHFLPINNATLIKDCIISLYGDKGFASPDFYRDPNGLKFKYNLCASSAQVSLLKNSIYLPPPFNKRYNYSSGKYHDQNLKKSVIWFPDMEAETIYTGLVDIWTIGRNKFLFGKTGDSKFTIQLVKKSKIYQKNLWQTNHDGILAYALDNVTIPVTGIRKQRFFKYISGLEGYGFGSICDSLPNKLRANTKTIIDLQRNLRYLTIGATVFILWVVTVSIFGCLMNYLVLKRRKIAGLDLLRCFCTTSTNHYIFMREDEPVKVNEPGNVHDYETIDEDCDYNK